MSKRDQQKKRKEQKQLLAKQRDKTSKLLTRIGLFGVVPVFALLVLYTLFSQGPTYSTIEVADNDHIRGSAESPVNIVVYADFQCPACATEHQTMSRIWPQLRDKAHLIFRHFPITVSHPNAWTASLYAEAAAKQGRFWEMHDYLFASQNVWSGLANVESEFDSMALELNLDLEQLKADIDSEEVIQKVRNDQRGGSSAGVRATPAIFINGRQLARLTEARIIAVVEEEFAAAETTD